MQGEAAEPGTEAVLRLEQERQTFVLTEVPEKPVVSVLRGFSAPVKLEVAGQTEEDLVFLLGHDSDSFSKWEAGQTLQRTLLLELYNAAMDESKVGGGCNALGLCCQRIHRVRLVLLWGQLQHA